MNNVLRSQEERNDVDALVLVLCTGERAEECPCWGCAFIGDLRQEYGRNGLHRLRAAFDGQARATTLRIVDRVRAAMDDSVGQADSAGGNIALTRDEVRTLRAWSKWLEAWVAGNKGDPDAVMRGPHAEGYGGQ